MELLSSKHTFKSVVKGVRDRADHWRLCSRHANVLRLASEGYTRLHHDVVCQGLSHWVSLASQLTVANTVRVTLFFFYCCWF